MRKTEHSKQSEHGYKEENNAQSIMRGEEESVAITMVAAHGAYLRVVYFACNKTNQKNTG